MQRIRRGTVYRIRVENPEHVRKGIKAIFTDGQQVESVRVFSSGTHDIRVIIG